MTKMSAQTFKTEIYLNVKNLIKLEMTRHDYEQEITSPIHREYATYLVTRSAECIGEFAQHLVPF